MNWIRIGAALLALGVGLGAFGAHALQDRIDPDMLEVWKTATHYHLIHALALWVLGIWADLPSSRAPRRVGWLISGGIVLFSGSLYLLVISDLRWLGAITPLGGSAFIIAWIWIAVAAGKPIPASVRSGPAQP